MNNPGRNADEQYTLINSPFIFVRMFPYIPFIESSRGKTESEPTKHPVASPPYTELVRFVNFIYYAHEVGTVDSKQQLVLVSQSCRQRSSNDDKAL